MAEDEQSAISIDLEDATSADSDQLLKGDASETYSTVSLLQRAAQSFKDPAFLVLLGLLFFLVFSFGPHEIGSRHRPHANIYRRCADFCHLVSFAVMLTLLWRRKSAAGVSVISQYLLLMVFMSRYIDLLFRFISTYNTMMKMLYIGLTAFIIFILKFQEPWKSSCAKTEDRPMVMYVGVPLCFLLAIFYAETHPSMHHRALMMEVFWEFSIYVEAIAIIPQLLVLRQSGIVDKYMMLYLLLRGAYRVLYILNWIQRSQSPERYSIDGSALLAAQVQTIPYLVFFATLYKFKK